MKGAVWVFKSISHLEKTVDSAELTLAPLESKLRARMNCRFSVSKTYSLPFLECEPLKANYDASHSKNGFTAQSKVLSEAALNFLSNQEEVTLLAERDAFVMKGWFHQSTSCDFGFGHDLSAGGSDKLFGTASKSILVALTFSIY